MSNLTEQLQQQLMTGATRSLMQDAQGHWYNGNSLNLEKQTWVNYWKTQGIGHNDIVLIALKNSVTYSLVTQSLWDIGAIVQPVNPATTEIQLSQLEAKYNYAALILETETEILTNLKNTFAPRPKLTTLHEPEVQIYLRRIHETHPAKQPLNQQIALIMHTSGTTGQPKRVGLTHQQLLANAENIVTSQYLTAQDHTLVVMPLFHINALVISNLATRLSKGQLLFRPKFSAHTFWHDVVENQITWVSLTPAIIEILLARPEQPAPNQLRFLRTASAPLLPSTHAAFTKRFAVPLVESYGMTEAASQITQNPLKAQKLNSVGRVFGPELKILDQHHQPVPANHIGEIAVKGTTVINHYLDPQPETFQDGWLLTGDLGQLDKDGYLFMAGRRKEMIIRGGENINPLAVEDCLTILPFIKEMAVVGLPDPIYGEAVTAVIVPNEPTEDHRYQLTLLENLAATQLLPVERPTNYIFSTDLPRNATGKIQRTLLAQEIQHHQLKEA
ncbi:AMP-binding protein [Agrilactobacillus yilanensis]|uniref:AMP-binding protein n=1 Tax=Agrilactobacillus yilanensis TaxID=2485997 RepID=A0ABW4J579_9LACO|nr:AMP-binding protein [Agrilactobacillus yilanensis]